MSKANRIPVAIVVILCAIAVLSACSPQAAGPQPTAAGSNADPDTNSDDGPTPFPTYNYVLPTSPPVFGAIAATAQATVQSNAEVTAEATAAAVEVASALDPQAVERGQGRYEALECGSCHGADGAGTENGPSLLGPSLDEEAFISFLRTGGTIGNDHLYSTNRLSDSGGRNLYQYIRSLSAS